MLLLLLPVSAAVRVSCCWLMGALGVGRGVKGRERYNFLIFCRVSNAQKKPKNKPPAAANRSQLHNHLLASFSLSLSSICRSSSITRMLARSIQIDTQHQHQHTVYVHQVRIVCLNRQTVAALFKILSSAPQESNNSRKFVEIRDGKAEPERTDETKR